MKVIAVIPARYEASRFPGKLMQILGEKLSLQPLIKTLWKRVCSMMFLWRQIRKLFLKKLKKSVETL